MGQTIHYLDDHGILSRELPDPTDTVIPGVRWGEHWALFTPAYWLSQMWMTGLEHIEASPFRARGSLHEEIVFCLLGGHGITAELATAAFKSCREAGLIARLEVAPREWANVLQEPLALTRGMVRYRYPHQKANFLAGAMVHLRDHPLGCRSGKELRDGLLAIKGVGPKTAGWIARNFLDSDDVAILDVHLVRAGLLCDLFSPEQRVERDYPVMESRFLEFCHALGARPAILDSLIWHQMRAVGRTAVEALSCKLGNTYKVPTGRPVAVQMSMNLES